jgi:hypothetical protein
MSEPDGPYLPSQDEVDKAVITFNWILDYPNELWMSLPRGQMEHYMGRLKEAQVIIDSVLKDR